MDEKYEKDELLKDLLNEINDKSVPLSFAGRVSSKIESERLRRGRRDEAVQIIIVTTVALALLVTSFIYLNNRFFNLSPEDFRLFNSTLGVKHLLSRIKGIFLGDGALLWYIIAVNTSLLIIIQQFAQNYIQSKKNGNHS